MNTPTLDEFMSHLARENIKYTGSDVDEAIAVRKLTTEGWKNALEYIIASCDEILSHHTAFSWHYEEDEGLEEDRVHPKKDTAQFTIDLGKKLQQDNLDLYSPDVLDLLKQGLGVCSRGYFGSYTYIDEVVNWGLDFLTTNAPTEELRQTIAAYRDPAHNKRAHSFDGRAHVFVQNDMTNEEYMAKYFPHD